MLPLKLRYLCHSLFIGNVEARKSWFFMKKHFVSENLLVYLNETKRNNNNNINQEKASLLKSIFID